MTGELKDVKSLNGSYESVVRELGADVIDSRFNKLLQQFKDFIEYIGASDKLIVNERILAIAVLDIFTDLNRLKSFHHIQDVNEYKEKAYESTWILRRKPIQVIDHVTKDDKYDYVNERFVYQYLMFFLMRDNDLIECAKKIEGEKGENYFLTLKGYLNALFYHLKFRDCNPQVLELLLMSFRAGEVANQIMNT